MNNNRGGISFAGALTILFVGLKLSEHIDWSWWWVLLPLWLGPAVLVVGFIVFLFVLAVRGVVRWVRS